jgi:hypothetical protein
MTLKQVVQSAPLSSRHSPYNFHCRKLRNDCYTKGCIHTGSQSLVHKIDCIAMPVTHLVYYRSVSSTLTDEGKAALGLTLQALDELEPKKSREECGAAVFQQIEDPKICLSTGSWEAAEQHRSFSTDHGVKVLHQELAKHFD